MTSVRHSSIQDITSFSKKQAIYAENRRTPREYDGFLCFKS